MKCLAISNSYPPDHAGGYELGACNLLESLASECGWQNTVVASVRKQKSPETDSLQLTGFFPGKLGPGISWWQTRRELLKKHSKVVVGLRDLTEKADIVFIFNPRRLIYPQWTSVLASGKPAFVLVSDHWLEDPLASDLFYSKAKKADASPRLKDGRIQSIYNGISSVSETLNQIKGVLYGSQFLKSKHAAAFSGSAKQTVAHWGVDINQFPEVPFSESRLKTFGFCSRPEKEKGLDLGLNSIRKLAQKDADVQLLIASDLKESSYGRTVLKRIHEDAVLSKHVTLLGHIPHTELHARFYSRIGILLFPSIWQEPFALTVLEGMSSGALVIGSSTGGTPEVLDESTGYLFDPEKEDELTATCMEALKGGTDNLNRVQCGIRRIREAHTLPYMAKVVDAFIRGLI